MTITSNYPEDYYRSNNYVDYMERGPRYEKMAFEIAEALKKFKFIDSKSRILDYGCAVGFLIQGFKNAGFSHTVGFEISEWAKSVARNAGHFVLDNFSELELQTFDLIIALDVLEHIGDEELKFIIPRLNADRLLVRIPVAASEGADFALDISRRDKTHVNCKTKTQWQEFFKQQGYTVFLDLDLYYIYDAKGVMCTLMLK